MIKLRNEGQLLVNLHVPGELNTAVNVATVMAPFACRVSAMLAKIGTAGAGSQMIVDIHKNGTTIYSSAKLVFDDTDVDPAYGALTADPVILAKGDILTLDIDQESTTESFDLNVWLVFERLKESSQVATMQTGTIGAENE
jgi:hypothetical protein